VQAIKTNSRFFSLFCFSQDFSASKQIAKQFTKASQLANSFVGETREQIHSLAF
jgi:hypothetical protein